MEIKSLVLIGNGFDLWQNLPTSYKAFGEYYEKNKDRIDKELKIDNVTISGKDGTFSMNYFEMFYWFCAWDIMGMGVLSKQGNCYGEDYKLPQTPITAEFWSDFENYLYDLDVDYILDAFREHNKIDLDIMLDNFLDLKSLLTEYLYQWINSVDIPYIKSEYDFNNCFFVNFNYTYTLRKRFGVNDALDYHIHGFCNNKASLCFGHTKEIEELEEYYEYEAVDIIKDYLHSIYKNPKQNIKQLKKYTHNKNINMSKIDTIYVLGHSFGMVDFEYFKFFAETFPNVKWKISYHSGSDIVRIRSVLLKLGITNYELNKNISNLIEPFKLA